VTKAQYGKTVRRWRAVWKLAMCAQNTSSAYKLLHKRKSWAEPVVNKYERKDTERLYSLAGIEVLEFTRDAVSVNKGVHNIQLLNGRNVVVFEQFIERTGATGIRRKKEDASSEDNPR
jgi:hypothetical protein